MISTELLEAAAARLRSELNDSRIEKNTPWRRETEAALAAALGHALQAIERRAALVEAYTHDLGQIKQAIEQALLNMQDTANP